MPFHHLSPSVAVLASKFDSCIFVQGPQRQCNGSFYSSDYQSASKCYQVTTLTFLRWDSLSISIFSSFLLLAGWLCISEYYRIMLVTYPMTPFEEIVLKDIQKGTFETVVDAFSWFLVFSWISENHICIMLCSFLCFNMHQELHDITTYTSEMP
jgi:hypothetical protein